MHERWFKSDDLFNAYNNYKILSLDVVWVPTHKIIGLSLWPPEKIFNDEKMKRLMLSVKETGWNDPLPQDLHLYLLPTKFYIVGTGGNHRPILADKLKIPEIKACVDVILPESVISRDIRSELNKIEKEINTLESTTQNKNDYLYKRGTFMRRDFRKEETELDKLYERLDGLMKVSNEILKKKRYS